MQFSIIAVLLVLIIGAVVAIAARARAKRARAMAGLALQLDWVSLPADPDALGGFLPLYLKVLFEQGSGVHIGASFTRSSDIYSNAYSAVFADHKVVFFQYDLTEYYYEDEPLVGQPHETSTTSNFIVVSSDLGTDVPAVFLVHHSLLSKLASFGEYKGMQQLKLEGDFNNYYDTYIMPDTQVETLELLTPDTMELLANVAESASMEFGGRSVGVSLEGRQMAPEVILPVLEHLRGLLANVDGKAQSQLQSLGVAEES